MQGEDHEQLLRKVEERRRDPEFMERLDRIVREDADVLAALAQGDTELAHPLWRLVHQARDERDAAERGTQRLVEALVIVAAANDASLLGDHEDERIGQVLDALYGRALLASRRDWTDEYTTVITDQGREFVCRAVAEFSDVSSTEGARER